MQKHISAAEVAPLRVVVVTLDNHLSSGIERAGARLAAEMPGLTLRLHVAANWGNDPAALARVKADIAEGDIIIANMLFIEEHIQSIRPAMEARRDHCDAMICFMSASEIVKLTKLGPFRMDGSQSGLMAMLKKLRGNKGPAASSGEKQMAMLRRLPKLLKYIPGNAQDLRAYFLAMQYWLAGSEENVANMLRLLVNRYASGPRQALRAKVAAKPPIEYPDVGVYHPRLPRRIGTEAALLPGPAGTPKGVVGLLLLRSYLLADNAGHYDGVIAALEARGLRVVPVFASGLDARPAIERYFLADGQPRIDALVSLTGFSLVGGPAYNDAKAAEEILARLDVPYLAAHPVEFQTLEEWQASERGLLPIEATIMVAIPELDGASGLMPFGGRMGRAGKGSDMTVDAERADMLSRRVANLVSLRRKARAERKVAIVLFNFPPNAGSTGTAAYLSVYASLLNTLKALAADGYGVEVPADVDDLRTRILAGNAERYGTFANVVDRIPTETHVRRERWLAEIEAQWGPAPGRQQSDGSSILVLGARFGNVLVGVQPAFGYEGDPMRLLFEHGFTPTHAFSAFYRYLRDDFAADAVLHFGTHGALEFMPGKQAGLSGKCWPDRLIGDLPNLYLYAANNPSEGTIAKRRAAATLISYLTPPVSQAGLYRGLLDLKSSIGRWRSTEPAAVGERQQLALLIQAQAAEVDMTAADPVWGEAADGEIERLSERVLELEYTLIPNGLHIVGAPPSAEERADLLMAMWEAREGSKPDRAIVEALVAGRTPEQALASARRMADRTEVALLAELQAADRLLAVDHEIPALLRALDGRFIRPAPSGDLVRAPDILPTGRNLHGFDPFRMPSAFAIVDGARQAARLLDRHMSEGHAFPETVAMVLWGTDNLKSEGGPIGQAMALMGARPRLDGYGRLCGAELVPLDDLRRPRVDVMLTLSGIFRDLLPLQTKMLAEAAFMAAAADEPLDQNFVRKHALAHQAKLGCDLETAALRVFSNAESAYGANVNLMIENGDWSEEDELAEAYTRRKCFAYGRNGAPVQQGKLLGSILEGVSLSYQNLESVELGVTTVDHYFDTLGGISRAVRRATGTDAPVYISDQTRGAGAVRTLGEQVALETRTRTLNPKWYEGMLKHGYEGVRQIEANVTNTMGWSATTGEVAPWVYQQITETFVLDPEMRARLAALNPTASAKMANRLIEAHERNYWSPDAETLEALRNASEELEDRLEGVSPAAGPMPAAGKPVPVAAKPSRQSMSRAEVAA